MVRQTGKRRHGAPRGGSRRSARKRTAHRWSAQVNARSDALDLREGMFKSHDPKAIAAALRESAETSRRRRGTAYQSAMSMLNFYINRAGRNLPRTQRDVLQRAKNALRVLYGRAPR